MTSSATSILGMTTILAAGNIWQFASMHEGGCFFAFCDGQVRFISENIDHTAYRALGTRANNEVVDDEDY